MFTNLLAAGVSPQQTIFNVPTPDVLDKGKVYVELDASFKAKRQDALGRFSSFVPRLVVGVGGNVEVGVNVAGNIHPGADSTTIVPTVKWKFYENEKRGMALFGGTHVFIPVRNRKYNIGSYSYVSFTKTINQTRLTVGSFVTSKNVFAPKAARGGAQFGFERAVNNKLTIAADWITGRHASGYLTPGIIHKPHPKVSTYWSYSIGNDKAAAGNHFFLFEIGYNLF